MKRLLITTIIISMIPIFMRGQTYSALWKQVKEAEQNDLPQTEQQVLSLIVKKAKKEHMHGQLLKAELQRASSICDVSSDSLQAVVKQLQQQAEQSADNVVLQSVYYCVLGYIYETNKVLDEDHYLETAREYYAKALEHPDKLAAERAANFEPFVLKGQDSRYFNDDLLSIIGLEAKRYDVLRNYYVSTGNRRAALLTSNLLLKQEEPGEMELLNKSRHLQRIDSLINEYQDLTECGEAAISRYDFMANKTDATAEQLWQYINLALERWGAWQRMNYLRNKQRELTNPQFSVHAQRELVIPQQEQMLEFSDLRNITDLTLRIYKVNADGGKELSPHSSEGYKNLRPLLTAMPELTQTIKFVGKRPYEFFKDSLTLPALPIGVYMLEIESQPATSIERTIYYVSDMRILTQPQPRTSGEEGRELRLVVVNATTGQPVKGAKVEVSYGYGQNKDTSILISGEDGECCYVNKDQVYQSYRIRAFTSDDNACPKCDIVGGFGFVEKDRERQITNIYTDRAIYRPGQKVHVAAIVYDTKGINSQVTAGKQIRFTLYDANHKTVSQETAVTDQYGTATTQFTLPAQGLTGMFSVQANGVTHPFHVEEYKRPAFEVDIPRTAQDYEDGDTVVATGTARNYAGVPVQGASVRYKVVRRHAYWWWSYSRYWEQGYIGTGNSDEVMAEGETTTDERGQFTVDMPMILPKTKYTMFYNFVLTADVTDQAGETHQGQLSLPMGNRSTAFSVTLPEKVLNEDDNKIVFHQQNSAGIDLDAQVRFRFDNGRWQETRTNALIDIPKMKSGRHTLQAFCKTDTLEQDFVVFSLDDRRPATDCRSWFYTSHNGRFPNDGSPVTVQAGSSDKDVHMIYSIFSGNKLLESGSMKLSNELLNRKFLYREEYGNGVLLTFAWMKDGESYTYSTVIERPMPDMHLNMKWTTFRNRLIPGQSEEWTLTITKPDGTPADAQLTATLYDKSLDQLQQHGWNLVPGLSLPKPYTRWYDSNRKIMHLYGMKYLQLLNWQGIQFNSFDHDVYPSYYYFRRAAFTRNRALMATAPMSLEREEAVMEDAAMDSKTMLKETVIKQETDDQDEVGGDEQPTASVQMRENLQETAFFMPQLLCDSTGLVTMKFTLPESLTTWRFLGIAHTKDMMYGSLNDEAVARKEVMIQPNMPRFVRQGDHATISARVMNMSDREISGTAMLQLLDPETEHVLTEERQLVTVADSSTVAVTFNVTPDASQLSQYSLVVCRVSISSSDYSDGEQHYLPLLPNKERVTVTVPFTQIQPGTKTVDLSQLVPVDDPQGKITIEYTNNPAWLMIQALPSIGHPHDDCAICQASSLYSNTIGQHILSQNPTAKHIFEQWSREQSTETSLMSSLQKDQELKDLLLTETPWVMDADNEQKQKQQLADFFDANAIDSRIASAVSHLQKLQKTDGSWSWWPDMKGSSYITTAVSEMLVRQNAMTGRQQPETQKMLERSFKFLGDDIVELVKEMKKMERKGLKPSFPSFRALQWLYICSLDGRKLPSDVAEANAYLKNLLKNESKNQSIYEKALSAIILQNKSYVKSLKEWTVYREDMGRYYDTQRASYSWRDYKIPTQVAVIEALKQLTPQDTVTISEMQRWLLQQKRTQAWDTPINSADAIYAFLNDNSQSLAPQPKTTLAVDGKALDTSDATAGIGYVKTTIPTTGQKTFTAEKTSAGTSWGAVYLQFTQATSDIADQQSGIRVTRELRGSSELKVGDKVTVRITIEADRDYDFVQVQDKRAACMEPVRQLSGYNWQGGYYCTPKDQSTSYFFNILPKGRHIIETEYYIDRAGTYETGMCTAQCAYSPEFRGTTKSLTITVQPRP